MENIRVVEILKINGIEFKKRIVEHVFVCPQCGATYRGIVYDSANESKKTCRQCNTVTMYKFI